MANESVTHSPALSGDEAEFLLLWRLLDANAKRQVLHAMTSKCAKGGLVHG